jgi:hypothetical protein
MTDERKISDLVDELKKVKVRGIKNGLKWSMIEAENHKLREALTGIRLQIQPQSARGMETFIDWLYLQIDRALL